MIRVLWLTKGLGRGGIEQLLSLSAAYIDRARFDVEVAYLLAWKDAFVPELERRGIETHCLGMRHNADLSWIRRLRSLARERQFDLVHTHSPYPAVAARIALGAARAPLLHTEHNVWPRYRWPTYAANAATYQRNAAVLAVSRPVAESIRPPRWMPWVAVPALQVVHHGIDESRVRWGPDARAEARRTLDLDEEELVLGTVGNFTPKKDHHSLLTAFAMLPDLGSPTRLVLVGAGPLEDELRRQVVRKDLGERVVFTGSRDDVQALLPAFDVFVLSSVYEGLSIALLEAMAAGLPSVATRVGGIPDALTDGVDGLLVAPRDPEALATAISSLLRNEPLRRQIGDAAMHSVRRFSIATAVRRTEQLYEDVLRSHGRLTRTGR
ncbi:MAG: glycosyltransferase [Egibacteraceae bacterium]